MTAWGVLDLCSRRGLTLRAEGNTLRVNGPAAARSEMRALLKDHKHELLACLREAYAGGRQVLPPDGPGQSWHRDWRGLPCNLARKEPHVLN